MDRRKESRLLQVVKLPFGVKAFPRGAHLKRLFPRNFLYVFERLAVIKEVLSAGHVHLDTRRRRAIKMVNVQYEDGAQDHLTLTVKPNSWQKTSTKLEDTVSLSFCPLQVESDM